MLCANWFHAVRKLSSVKGVSKSSRAVVGADCTVVDVFGPSRISRNDNPIGRLKRFSEGAAVGVGVATTGREEVVDVPTCDAGCTEGGIVVVTGREAVGCTGTLVDC